MERFGLGWAEVHDGLPAALLVILTRQPAAAAPIEDPPDAPTDADADAARKRLMELQNNG